MPAQSASVLAWRDELGALEARLGGLFGRPEPRRQAGLYLEGLLSATKRKNGWQLAEQIGDARPWRTQRLLSHVLWDQDAARDLCRDYVVEHLGAPDGVLIVDETGFLKKGEHSAGVARQYSGTAGRIENAQIGVFLAYASGKGHALIDRELYLPRKEWCEEEAKRAEAAIPDQAAFATKPVLASRMIGRALDAGLPCAWVLGDEVYGSDRRLRRELERRGQAFVLAIRGNEKLWSKLHDRPGRHAIAGIAAALPARAWRRFSAGAGSKGERLYDWARLPTTHPRQPPWGRWVLIRRSRKDPKDLAFYVAFGPVAATLATLARVAGRRWAVEECFEVAKQEVGLADYEIRSWHGWYRHITLAMLALAFLAALRLRLNAATSGQRGKSGLDLRSISARARSAISSAACNSPPA
jgi:SRSO17 transposase